MTIAPERAQTVTVVSARSKGSLGAYLKECWERRSLVSVLTSRELKGSYEMNIVGFAWWLVEPLSLTLVYVVLVQLILKTAEPAFPLFILTALLPFKWLNQSVLGAMGTMRINASLVTDVYFPRALLPFADTVNGLAHFLVGLLVIPFFMIPYRIHPSWHLVFLPVAIAAQFLLTVGLAYPLAVWGLYYRNLPNLMGNILRLWFYLSPALWAMSRINPKHHGKILLVKLNPLTGIFEGYRGALGLVSKRVAPDKPPINIHQVPGWELAWAAGVGVLLLIVGGYYFYRRESAFGKYL